MSIKKTIITTILALALVAVVAPGAAQALTANDLLVQIAQLQAQLSTLQGQSQAGTTTGILPTNCVGIDFTRNLSRSMVGSDVKCLQSILNQLNVNVADAGAGSPGHETTFFGGATRAAVIRFQEMFGLGAENGTIGTATLAKLNSLLLTWRTPSNLPAGCTSTTGYSSTTGVSCATPSGLPAGCTSTSGYSPTTGASCATGVVTTTLPAGCTSTSGYSPTTGVSCATGVSNQPVGLTGFIDVSTLAASPASNSNITTTSNIPVLGINVKAINANMTVNSLKVQLTDVKLPATLPATAEHPATLVNKLYVYDGSTLLGTYGVDTNSVYKTSAGLYYVILSGFNFMVPANTTKALTINADFAPSLETNRQLTVNLFATDSVGATDGTGATRTSGVTTQRIYTVKYASVGASTLTVTANTGTPISTSVNVDTTNGASDVPMLVFNTKSVTGASKITDLTFTVTGTDADTLNKVSSVKLYDGSALLGSVSLTGAGASRTAAFTDQAIAVAKDATKSLLVKVDIASDLTNPAASSGDWVQVDLAPANVTYDEPDLTSATSVGAVVLGKQMVLFDNQAAVITFVSGTSTYTVPTSAPTDGYTTGVITIKVKADGGTMTKPVAGDFVVHAFRNGSDVFTVTTKSVTVTPNTDVSDGSEATVVLNVSATLTNTGAGFVDFRVQSIDWTVGAIGPVTQNWGLEDFKTPASNAQ